MMQWVEQTENGEQSLQSFFSGTGECPVSAALQSSKNEQGATVLNTIHKDNI